MARQTLILIPGLICDDAVWRYTAEHLAEIADCVIVPADKADTMQQMAADVLTSLPAGRVAVAGFSMGGYVATEMLRQAPERIERLALLDTSSRIDPPDKADGRRRTIADCEQGRFDDVIEKFVPLLLHPDRMADPLADTVRQMGHRVGAETFARRHRAMLTRSAPRDVLESFAGPVRVIMGRDDQLTSLEEHSELADWPQRGRLSIVEDCGHMPPLERPQAATALLRDWLIYD
jgi:pimeloyl-ACP methyl ester carboxylesterase